MASTLNPPTKAVAEWMSVFQAQGTENYTSSVMFMKQLTVVALSTITFIKNSFPVDNFNAASFGGMKLKILKKKCDDELAQFVSTSIAQAFEAFDKKYLHQLVLCFYEEECKPENLVEYYIFEYSYSPDGVSMHIQSKNRNSEKKDVKCTFEDVQRQTAQLIRACVVLVQTSPHVINHNYDISLQLYYNDDAPEGYQAPGYQNCPDNSDHLEPTLQQAIALGWVDSKYHKLVARAYMRDTFVSGDVEPSQNVPMMTQSEDQSSFRENESETSDTQIRCPCNKYENKGELMITCYYCSTQQHAACFGLLPHDVASVAKHCCTVCSDTKQLPPSDQRLAELSDRKRECLCIFRRALAWLAGRAGAAGAELAARFNMSALNVAKLMRLLHSYGIVDEGDNDLMTPKKINSEPLKIAISKYFRSQETVTDDLIGEAFGSQGSQPDPVGDVLSPMEKVSLQNESILGRVISNPAFNKAERNAEEDEVLKQYRDAISCSAETMILDELPLSGSHNPVQDIDKVIKDTEMKCSVKRKMEDGNEKVGRQLRSGVKTKKVRKF